MKLKDFWERFKTRLLESEPEEYKYCWFPEDKVYCGQGDLRRVKVSKNYCKYYCRDYEKCWGKESEG